ncbi:hypothetical protein L209DRAFT_466694 [Thermothelomyces heterothallicus CBS 203.75]
MVTCSQYSGSNRYTSLATPPPTNPPSPLPKHTDRGLQKTGPATGLIYEDDGRRCRPLVADRALRLGRRQMGAYFNVVPQVDRHTRDEALEPVPPRDIEMASKGTFWGLRGLDGASGIL